MVSTRLVRALLASAVVLVVALGIARWRASEPEPGPHRVLVYGIDGATWSVMEPMIEAGELPTIGRFYRRGMHGVLRSRAPAISPVAWTTIFTGRLPEDHKVRSWSTSQSTHRAVKVVWEITSDAGLPTHVFNVPSSWPAEPIEGVMLSGFPVRGSHVGGNTGRVVRGSDLDDPSLHRVYLDNASVLRAAMHALAPGRWSPWLRVYTGKDVAGVMRVRALDRGEFWLSPFYRTDDALEMSYPPDLRATALRGVLSTEYIPEGPGWDRHDEPQTAAYLAEHLQDIARTQTDAVKLYAGSNWRLLVYVHTLVDRVSHPYWPFMHAADYPQVTPARGERYGEAVRQAYRTADAHLAEIVAKIKGPFTLVIVSDHGFRSQPKRTIGVHDMAGVYLVSGGGAPAGRGPELHIEDVAPTVLYMLDLPTAEDITGQVPAELVAATGRPAPTPVATYEAVARAASDEPVDPVTWEQLRGLGYVDGPAPEEATDQPDTDD